MSHYLDSILPTLSFAKFKAFDKNNMTIASCGPLNIYMYAPEDLQFIELFSIVKEIDNNLINYKKVLKLNLPGSRLNALRVGLDDNGRVCATLRIDFKQPNATEIDEALRSFEKGALKIIDLLTVSDDIDNTQIDIENTVSVSNFNSMLSV